MIDEQGIYLGMRGQTPVFYRGDRHVLTLGPTGSGKGTGLIIPTLSTFRGSALVIDCKGESAAVVAARRRWGDVIVLNPFGVMVDRYPDLQKSRIQPSCWDRSRFGGVHSRTRWALPSRM